MAATILLGVISFDPAFFMGRQLLLIRPGVRRSGSSAEFVYQRICKPEAKRGLSAHFIGLRRRCQTSRARWGIRGLDGIRHEGSSTGRPLPMVRGRGGEPRSEGGIETQSCLDSAGTGRGLSVSGSREEGRSGPPIPSKNRGSFVCADSRAGGRQDRRGLTGSLRGRGEQSLCPA